MLFNEFLKYILFVYKFQLKFNIGMAIDMALILKDNIVSFLVILSLFF